MKNIEVDGKTKIAVVEMEAGRVLTPADCAKAFESTSYSVKKFEAIAAGG